MQKLPYSLLPALGRGAGPRYEGSRRVVFGAVNDPEGGFGEALAQPVLYHAGVLGLGVGEGDEELGGAGLAYEVGDAQGIERRPDDLGSELALRGSWAKGQDGERQVEIGGDGELLAQGVLELLGGIQFLFHLALGHRGQYTTAFLGVKKVGSSRFRGPFGRV